MPTRLRIFFEHQTDEPITYNLLVQRKFHPSFFFSFIPVMMLNILLIIV